MTQPASRLPVRAASTKILMRASASMTNISCRQGQARAEHLAEPRKNAKPHRVDGRPLNQADAKRCRPCLRPWWTPRGEEAEPRRCGSELEAPVVLAHRHPSASVRMHSTTGGAQPPRSSVERSWPLSASQPPTCRPESLVPRRVPGVECERQSDAEVGVTRLTPVVRPLRYGRRASGSHAVPFIPRTLEPETGPASQRLDRCARRSAGLHDRGDPGPTRSRTRTRCR